MTRGDVVELRASRRARGHEQRGARYGVIVQAPYLDVLSTVLVAPTSTGAWPSSYRPEVTVRNVVTRVMVEQLLAVDRRRLGRLADRLSLDELGNVDKALRVVLDLR